MMYGDRSEVFQTLMYVVGGYILLLVRLQLLVGAAGMFFRQTGEMLVWEKKEGVMKARDAQESRETLFKPTQVILDAVVLGETESERKLLLVGVGCATYA